MDVGAKRYLARDQAVAATVAGEERDVDAIELAQQKGVGRRTVGRVHRVLAHVGQALHPVQAASSENADANWVHRILRVVVPCFDVPAIAILTTAMGATVL